LRRLEQEAALWREEPLRRIAVRNQLVRPLRTRQFHSFGAHSIVDRPKWLYGTHHIAVGEGVIVLADAWLSAERSTWERTAPVVRIGDAVAIRLGVTISAAHEVVVEDAVLMGRGVTVVDSRHTWTESHPSALHGAFVGAPIRIGRGTWLADKVTVAAGVDIGEHCIVGANCVVTSKLGRVPDGAIVVGNPATIVGSTDV
jgi:acetyltransferase-like isoleucine patch superfamily enzyme